MKLWKLFLTVAGVMIISLSQPQTVDAQQRELYREGHYVFTVWRELSNDGRNFVTYAMIVDYTGPGGSLQIPSVLNGLPVVAILDEAFFGKGLTNVTIPSSVTGIGTVPGIGIRAFDSNELTSVTLPNGLTHIGAEAFAGNKLTTVTIPNGVTHIEDFAFAENRLTRVNMPGSVTYIGVGAFAENLLTSISIPNGVIYIGEIAFISNRLTNVTVPSRTQIGANAFAQNGQNGDRETTITRR